MAYANYRSDSALIGAGSDGDGGDGGRECLRLNGERSRKTNTNEDILDVNTLGDKNTKNRSDVCERSIRNSSSMRRLVESDGLTGSSNTVPELRRSEERDKSARPGRSPRPQLATEIVEFDANNCDHGETNLEDDGCSLPSSLEISSSRTLSEDSLV